MPGRTPLDARGDGSWRPAVRCAPAPCRRDRSGLAPAMPRSTPTDRPAARRAAAAERNALRWRQGLRARSGFRLPVQNLLLGIRQRFEIAGRFFLVERHSLTYDAASTGSLLLDHS